METQRKTQQVANLPAVEPHNARNLDDRKERVGLEVVVAWNGRAIEQPVEARYWMSRNATGMGPLYCSVWIRTADGRYMSGHGKVSGCGYHKASAALAEALASAGVALALDISGVGTSAAWEALEAVARAAGYVGPLARIGG